MRLTYLTVSALAAAFLSFPASAQSLPVCVVDLVAPAQGAHFLGSRPIYFQWSGEPAGTASRELHLAGLDGSETVIALDGRFSDTVKVKMTGDLAWVVVFLDAAGNPLCTTPAGLLTKGAGGGNVALSNDSLSGQAGGPGAVAAAKVSVFMNNGRLVIVLQNSPYAGAYTKLVASDNYNATNEDLMGASGIEFHGNNLSNLVTGSPGGDLIFLYDGNDTAEGGAGDDILVGGAGNDALKDVAGGGDADTLYGGPGADDMQIVDGDTNDAAYGGTDLDTGSANGSDILEQDGPDGP
jgi:hypothetical protein